jgi:hypothetical protein
MILDYDFCVFYLISISGISMDLPILGSLGLGMPSEVKDAASSVINQQAVRFYFNPTRGSGDGCWEQR